MAHINHNGDHKTTEINNWKSNADASIEPKLNETGSIMIQNGTDDKEQLTYEMPDGSIMYN